MDFFYIFKDETFTKLPFHLESASYLISDLDQNIWLTSEEDGLYTYRNNTFEKIHTKDLPQSISFLQDTPDGYMWGICSDNRVFYSKKSNLLSEPSKATIQYIISGDELPLINSNTRQQPSAELLSNGNIIFPNIHGAIHINPTKYRKKRSKYNIQIFIDSIEIAGHSQVELKPNRYYIDLKIKGIYLNLEAKILNEFKLDDNDWASIENGESKRIDLTNYGNHKLATRTKHINSEWVNLSTININVQRPFYLTLWFNSLMGLLLISVIYLITTSRT